MDFDGTREVLAALEQGGVEYAIFGGVALNLHGLARATDDLDVFIRPDRMGDRYKWTYLLPDPPVLERCRGARQLGG